MTRTVKCRQLEEWQERKNVTEKLIEWLGGNETVSFTETEKELLSKPGSSVELILKNHGINLEELPKAPSPKGGP